jgi:YD repeat-containing protein
MANNYIRDNRGNLLGFTTELSEKERVYSDARGRVVARVIYTAGQWTTFDKTGRFVGYGDLGMIEMGKR